MQRTFKNNLFYFLLKKILLLLNFFYKYYLLISYLILLNLFILKINNFFYINKYDLKLLNLNKISFNKNIKNKKYKNYNYIIKNRNKNKKNNYKNKNFNNNLLYKNNIKKNKLNNEKRCFLIICIKIKNNFFIDSINFGLKKQFIYNISKIINKFININNLSKNDKFIIFTYSRNLNELNSDINKLIYIKIISKNKKIYIFKNSNNKYYKFNINNNKFMRLPTLKKFKITSKFNLNRLNPITSKISPHKGIDIAMPIGTPILSVSDGVIKENSKNNKAGNYIVIKHSDRCITKYMHLKKSIVKKGQFVNFGECIGYSGNSGRTTGPHLHFEIWVNYKAVNPLTIKLNNKYNKLLYINKLKKIISNKDLDILNYY